MAKKAVVRYHAVYTRDTDGRWNVEVPKVSGCYTYGRTIAQARERVREALGLFVTNAEQATIVDEIRLPAVARQRLARLKNMRVNAERSERQLRAAQRAAAAQLRAAGLSFRDSGEVMGVTRQRAEQLTKPLTA